MWSIDIEHQNNHVYMKERDTSLKCKYIMIYMFDENIWQMKTKITRLQQIQICYLKGNNVQRQTRYLQKQVIVSHETQIKISFHDM